MQVVSKFLLSDLGLERILPNSLDYPWVMSDRRNRRCICWLTFISSRIICLMDRAKQQAHSSFKRSSLNSSQNRVPKLPAGLHWNSKPLIFRCYHSWPSTDRKWTCLHGLNGASTVVVLWCITLGRRLHFLDNLRRLPRPTNSGWYKNNCKTARSF